MQGRDNKKKVDSLITDKTAKGHAAPAHAAHEAAGETLATVPVDIVAVLDVHGDGLRAGADKRVLPRAAHGSIEARASSHCSVVAIAQVDVDIDGAVELRQGEEFGGLRALLGLVKGGGPGM